MYNLYHSNTKQERHLNAELQTKKEYNKTLQKYNNSPADITIPGQHTEMGDRVRGSTPGVGKSVSVHITSHPGQLRLAIPPWVGAMSTSQRTVMLCGWGVKAGMVREWVTGKTACDPLAITGHI